MTLCVVCQDRPADEGWLVDRRCFDRLDAALRQVPHLVEELAALGTFPVFVRDPVSQALPAGPLNGSRNGARVSGTPDARLPIRIDPTDLLARPRHGSVAVRFGPYAADQVGHLSAATILDFWVRDWADIRGEHLPLFERDRSHAATLCRWLGDRLDWACRHHFALDEFATDLRDLLGALFGLCGYGQPRPKVMEAHCPGCHLLTLTQSYPEANIECDSSDCGRILTPKEYEEWVRSLIEAA